MSPGGFPTTRWTLILSAREGEPSRSSALEQLLAVYWKPVYFYLRRRGLAVEDAEDAVQDLFTRLVERDFPARLDPDRGRFRSYLLTAMDHHLVNLHERRSAQKRGGGARVVPLDLVLAERELAAAPEDPLHAYQREWALGLMERAVARLRAEYDDGTRKGSADAVLRFFRLDGAPSYAEAAGESGMTVPQFKAALHRARRRFRELLREEVEDTVDGGQAEPELAELVRVLAS